MVHHPASQGQSNSRRIRRTRRNEIGEWDAAMGRLWAGWNETKARACQWMVLRVRRNRVRAPCRKKCAGGGPGHLPPPAENGFLLEAGLGAPAFATACFAVREACSR